MKYAAAFLIMLVIGSCAQAQQYNPCQPQAQQHNACQPLIIPGQSSTVPRKLPEYETVNLTILKIERVREETEGALWYTNKLTMRDSRGIIYKASAKCIQVTPPPLPPPDNAISCGHLAMPRIAETYAAKFLFGGTLIYFGEILPGTQGFEIESEEVSPQARAK